MARVAITEYAAKKLLLGEHYNGISVTPDTLNEIHSLSTTNKYVVKIDTGVKKRGIKGLLSIDVEKDLIREKVERLFELGHERCLVEQLVTHDERDERYLSLSFQREGLLVLHSQHGGVDVEAHSEHVQRTTIARGSVLEGIQDDIGIEGVNLQPLIQVMLDFNISFLEANPFLLKENLFLPLDLAVEIDTAKQKSLPGWMHEHVLAKRFTHDEERRIAELDASSQASFNLHVLNKNGSILTLLSGGGASLVAIDSLIASELKNDIINYSEYSGAPTSEETRRFTEILLSVLMNSSAPKKVVLIAGGVSNFTDVLSTFRGIVDAIENTVDFIKAKNVSFVVRRGGLNQTEGLEYLEQYLTKRGINHTVYGPETPLYQIGSSVKKFL